MSENPIITELTPKQKALIPVYREKWRKIALSTKRVDEDKATEAIKAGYNLICEKEPEVLFFDSLYAGIEELEEGSSIEVIGESVFLLEGIRFPLKSDITITSKQNQYQHGQYLNSVVKDPQKILSEYLLKKLYIELEDKINEQIEEQWDILFLQLSRQLDEEGLYIPHDCTRGNTHLDLLISECSYYDYCISVLNYPYNQNQWDILQNIVKNCGWIFPYQHTCIVCHRPTSLSFDEQNNLHESSGKPAIEYADGFKVYAHHGVWLAEKYGNIPTSQWKSQWLLEEENAELRRVLVQGIGYNRICEELGAVELDSWQEYSLLKIENYIEVDEWASQDAMEPMHLLKMTCPSTRHIHFLRVPPNIDSARVAIAWVNWGIDPEDFAVQT